ncbi:hypothetical protein HIM_08091 [Hirsutella minnesotensis 3608]|uniref:mannan endo-1,6-alpha-mannosidase n=1 Tax=Hirsutella minnesotensis 3608 TaxID=1043627 RepID=A0A0F7ZYJ2_9HYPO|nr:hypothetical protein HIM_08091 [Hirsutella minnesotensis 3608]
MVRFPSGLGSLTAAAALLLSYSSPWGADAYTLDPNSRDSIKSVAKNMADDMLTFYDGDKPGGTPGLLPQPYYWWEAGAMLGALIDYWYYTADSSYNDLITEGLLFQVGENDDYMPRNQTLTEGNDDQGFWGLAVMSAAENNFPNPPPDKPQWLGLAQAVFNTQAARWDTEHCAGGLRWQIFHWNKGFDYKNSISQACFFALGARLAVYTGNSSYADWAEKTWDWMINVKFIDEYWRVFDGAHIGTNCTNIVPYQFSYNAGGMILGAAAMYNFTEDRKWKDRLDKLLEGSKVFFTGPESNIMTEVACEPVDRCNLDQQSFKAYLSRWLAAITKWAPHTYGVVLPYLKASAVAAAKQCVGGSNGRMCGLKWNQDKYDGTTGIGQQMAAMEVTLSCMIKDRAGPVTAHTGGTSKGKPGAGGDDIGRQHPKGPNYGPITAGDKAGAAILTLFVMIGMMIGMFWIFLDESSNQSPLEQVKGAGGAAATSIAALAAAGGAAAIIQRSRGAEPGINEKKGTVVSMTDGRGQRSGIDENNKTLDMTTIKIGKVRTRERGPQPRRVSSMPLGWPHNPNLRSNSAAGVSRDELVSSRQGDRPSPSGSDTFPSLSTVSADHGTPRK